MIKKGAPPGVAARRPACRQRSNCGRGCGNTRCFGRCYRAYCRPHSRRSIGRRSKVLVRRAVVVVGRGTQSSRGTPFRRSCCFYACHRRHRAPDGPTERTEDQAVALAAVTLLRPYGHAVEVQAVVTAGAAGQLLPPSLAHHLAQADRTQRIVVSIVVVCIAAVVPFVLHSCCC